jgi:hypothetical protein
MLQPQVEVWNAVKVTAFPQSGKFEWASLHLGGFMNYLGWGCANKEALNGLADEAVFIWDVGKMTANIPLTKEGKIPRITMTELKDVGKFVSKACEMEFGTWKEYMGMAGDVKGMDEVTELIEKVRGMKMEVKYRSFEEVERDAENTKDPLQKLWRELELAYARDEYGEGVFDSSLNNAFQEEVKPMSISEYLEKYWAQD